MKAEAFKKVNEAIKVANYRQLGGKSCALVIGPVYVVVCDPNDVESYASIDHHIEYFWAEDDERQTSST